MSEWLIENMLKQIDGLQAERADLRSANRSYRLQVENIVRQRDEAEKRVGQLERYQERLHRDVDKLNAMLKGEIGLSTRYAAELTKVRGLLRQAQASCHPRLSDSIEEFLDDQ